MPANILLQAGGAKKERHKLLDEPTLCNLVALVDSNGQPANLTLIESAQGTRHLLVTQVLTTLCNRVFARDTLQREIKRVHTRGDPFKCVGTMLKAKLVSLGAVNPRGPTCLLATLASVIKALKARQMPALMLEKLADLHRGTGCVLEEATSRLADQNVVGSTQPTSLVFAEQMPYSIDLAAAPALKPRQRYSLTVIKPSLAHSSVLTLQLEDLRRHSKTAIVIGRELGPVKSQTYKDIHEQIMLYLGFIHLHFAVAHPNLTHYARADWLAAYCGARGARGDRGVSICKVTSTAKRVALYYRIRCPDEASRLTDLHRWLGELSSQIRIAWPSPKRNITDMTAAGTWASAAVVVGVLVEHKTQIEQALGQVESLTYDQARRLHDIALACCMFGWLPPPRSSTIRTLCSTGHRGPCPEPDCSSESCWGNRLYMGEGSRLIMDVPHHKSEKTWGMLHLVLPADLSALLILYLNKGYHVLRRDLEVEHPYAFMTKTGLAFETDTFSNYFKQFMISVGGPAIAPHSLRHIFVLDQMDNAHMGGFAYCMGHDLAQWDRSYDLLSLQRRGQQSIDAMQAWRTGLLTRAGAVVPAPSTPPVLLDVPSSPSDVEAPSSPFQASWQSGSSTSVSSHSSLERSSRDESSESDDDEVGSDIEVDV